VVKVMLMLIEMSLGKLGVLDGIYMQRGSRLNVLNRYRLHQREPIHDFVNTLISTIHFEAL
jgi:hypothetical protein